MPGFSKNLQSPPQARTKAGSRSFDVSQAAFLSSEATKRQPRPEYERRTYSRKRNRTSAAITALKADVIFSPTGWAERDGRLSAGGRNRLLSREHGKAPVKTPPAGTCPQLPPHADAPALRPPNLSVSAPSASALFSGRHSLPHVSRPISIAAPSCLAPLSPKRVQHPALPRRRLRLPTPLPSASPPAGGAKKSPLSEKERGPGLTPKTRGCAPYASGSKSSGKSALVYTFCTSSSSSSASVMRMSFCAVSASTGTSTRGTMAS